MLIPTKFLLTRHDSVAVNVITIVDAIHLKVVGITCHGNYRQ